MTDSIPCCGAPNETARVCYYCRARGCSRCFYAVRRRPEQDDNPIWICRHCAVDHAIFLNPKRNLLTTTGGAWPTGKKKEEEEEEEKAP